MSLPYWIALELFYSGYISQFTELHPKFLLNLASDKLFALKGVKLNAFDCQHCNFSAFFLSRESFELETQIKVQRDLYRRNTCNYDFFDDCDFEILFVFIALNQSWEIFSVEMTFAAIKTITWRDTHKPWANSWAVVETKRLNPWKDSN